MNGLGQANLLLSIQDKRLINVDIEDYCLLYNTDSIDLIDKDNYIIKSINNPTLFKAHNSIKRTSILIFRSMLPYQLVLNTSVII